MAASTFEENFRWLSNTTPNNLVVLWSEIDASFLQIAPHVMVFFREKDIVADFVVLRSISFSEHHTAASSAADCKGL